jgi:hypothetical protein
MAGRRLQCRGRPRDRQPRKCRNELGTFAASVANLFKIRIRQIAEHLDINIVVDKRPRVSLQANLRQPFRNLPHGRPHADLPALPATGEASAYQF